MGVQGSFSRAKGALLQDDKFLGRSRAEFRVAPHGRCFAPLNSHPHLQLNCKCIPRSYLITFRIRAMPEKSLMRTRPRKLKIPSAAIYCGLL